MWLRHFGADHDFLSRSALFLCTDVPFLLKYNYGSPLQKNIRVTRSALWFIQKSKKSSPAAIPVVALPCTAVLTAALTESSLSDAIRASAIPAALLISLKERK